MSKTELTWSDWIRSHGPQLVLYARRWAVDQAQAEDLVQEAFVRFWQSRQQVDEPLAYLYRCVRTTAIDAARSQSSRTRREQAKGVPSMAPQLSCPLEDDERRQQIESALKIFERLGDSVAVLSAKEKLASLQQRRAEER